MSENTGNFGNTDGNRRVKHTLEHNGEDVPGNIDGK